MSANEEVKRSPFSPFNFKVEFYQQTLGDDADTDGKQVPVCSGVFSECTGIDATMEPKVIKEGGRNYGANQRVGPVTFSTVILKRGMTDTNHLWQWWSTITGGKYAIRMRAKVTVLDISGQPAAVFLLERALPVKFKGPDLNAMTANTVAIEELHIAHEGLRHDRPKRDDKPKGTT
jgi:phage tail-like protein